MHCTQLQISCSANCIKFKFNTSPTNLTHTKLYPPSTLINMYRPHLLLSVPKLIVACWLVCSWILSSAEMKICTRSLLMYVDVGFPTRPHSLILCIAGNGLHPAIIYQIFDLAPHAYGNRGSNWRGTSVFICIRIILSYYQWWWKSLSFSL